MKGAKVLMPIPSKRKISNHRFFSIEKSSKKRFLDTTKPIKPMTIIPISNAFPKGKKKAKTLAKTLIPTIPAVRFAQRLVKVKPNKREVNFPQPKSNGSITSKLRSK